MDYWPDGDLLTPGLLYDLAEMAPNNNRAYARVPAADSTSYTALPTTPCYGSFFVRDSAGVDRWFAGSQSRLYRANGSGGWTDVSKSGGYGGLSWDGCAFGLNTIAANGNAYLQVASTATAFSDISAGPLGAWIVYVHKNALIALGSSSDGAAWARSATGDYTTWAAAANNDADSGTLYGGIGGKITAGCAYGNLAIAWKSNVMYGGLYVGNSDPNQDIIKWDVISDDPAHGCAGQWAWERTKAGLFFASPLDILLFQGNSPVSIADKIRKTWLAEAYANNSRIFLTHDLANNHIYVWVSPSGQTANTRAWIYNYKTDQWGKLVQLNDMTNLPLGNPKIPIRNATYSAFTSVGGKTNTRQICNLIFDDSITPHAANVCGETYNTDAYLRTGFKGKPDTESFLHRVYCISDSFAALPSAVGSIPQLDATSLDVSKQKTSTKTTYLANGGWWDVGTQGTWFYSRATFPGAGGTVSIQKLLHEMRAIPRVGPNGPTQVVE